MRWSVCANWVMVTPSRSSSCAAWPNRHGSKTSSATSNRVGRARGPGRGSRAPRPRRGRSRSRPGAARSPSTPPTPNARRRHRPRPRPARRGRTRASPTHCCHAPGGSQWPARSVHWFATNRRNARSGSPARRARDRVDGHPDAGFARFTTLAGRRRRRPRGVAHSSSRRPGPWASVTEPRQVTFGCASARARSWPSGRVRALAGGGDRDHLRVGPLVQRGRQRDVHLVGLERLQLVEDRQRIREAVQPRRVRREHPQVAAEHPRHVRVVAPAQLEMAVHDALLTQHARVARGRLEQDPGLLTGRRRAVHRRVPHA